jgi:hypothetical protein
MNDGTAESLIYTVFLKRPKESKDRKIKMGIQQLHFDSSGAHKDSSGIRFGPLKKLLKLNLDY